MPPNAAIAGHWRNERGSTLVLRVDGSTLNGTYRTAVGNADPIDDYALSGLIAGNLLTFSVLWAGSDSLTSWTGRYEPNDDRIHTLWHLVRSHASTTDDATGARIRKRVDVWGAFTTQASIFTRLPG